MKIKNDSQKNHSLVTVLMFDSFSNHNNKFGAKNDNQIERMRAKKGRKRERKEESEKK